MEKDLHLKTERYCNTIAAPNPVSQFKEICSYEPYYTNSSKSSGMYLIPYCDSVLTITFNEFLEDYAGWAECGYLKEQGQKPLSRVLTKFLNFTIA